MYIAIYKDSNLALHIERYSTDDIITLLQRTDVLILSITNIRQ